jgi:hypothetical protein
MNWYEDNPTVTRKEEQMMDESQSAMGMTTLSAGRMIKPSVTESLQREKTALLERLADIEEALAVLREYPDVQKVIDILSKHTRF